MGLRILVVGGGAREDALSWRLARSASCDAVFAAPGNAGTASRGENWAVSPTDGRNLLARALEAKIDLVVVGPETAIAAGVTDRLREGGLAVFGPSRAAGRLESSKIYAKRFMERNGIPTARSRVVHSLAQAERALEDWRGGCVVKADGLAAGKGVVVTDGPDGALTVLRSWYGAAGVPGGGRDVVLEQRLEGREVSVFAIGDGRSFATVASACDFKRAGDGDTGPNTGGMGAYSPPAEFPADLHAIVQERIVEPVRRGLEEERERYVGVLYCGLMWTASGPQVIEFNVRFGDPETQVLVPRVSGDFARYLESAARGRLDRDAASFNGPTCVGVVLATGEYPARSTPLAGIGADVALDDGRAAFWGSSTLRDGVVDAAGGRVLTVTACGDDLRAARSNAYGAVDDLSRRIGRGTSLTYRTDIAAAALAGTKPPPPPEGS